MKRELLLLSLAVMGSFSSPAFCADAEQDEIRTEIQALKLRIARLEERLAAAPESAEAGGPVSPEGTPAVTVPGMMDGIGISGYVDATYLYNLNHPDTRTNVGRFFDRHPNSFGVNAAELDFHKPVTPESRVGFRTDLLFGNDAELIGSAGLGTTDDEFDLQQAYVEMLVPAGNAVPGLNDIDLKAGKFATLFGAEVLESKDNWNTSRSFMFSFAEPGSHTGVLGTTVFDNGWDLTAGVVNGWDVFDDNNNGKSIIAHFGLNSIPLPADSSLTISLNGIIGPEAASDDDSDRTLSNIVLIYKTPWKPLTLMYNFDYGHQDDVLSLASSGVDGGDANWYGHAGYVRWDIHDQWSLSGRGEYFNDTDGVRVVPGLAAAYWEFTGTLEYRPWKNAITRLELRYDGSDHDIFNDENLPVPSLSDEQTTLSGEIIFFF